MKDVRERRKGDQRRRLNGQKERSEGTVWCIVVWQIQLKTTIQQNEQKNQGAVVAAIRMFPPHVPISSPQLLLAFGLFIMGLEPTARFKSMPVIFEGHLLSALHYLLPALPIFIV